MKPHLTLLKSLGAEGVIQGRWERANLFLARTNVRMRAGDIVLVP